MMKEEKLIPGSVFGGIFLITGSCIGAGMLALPVLTGLAGFFPSLIIFFLAWLFMTFTGLLLVEINGWFYRRVNILSMAEEALGKWGKGVSWILYLFLFYSLLVAYTVGSGEIFSSLFSDLFSVHFSSFAFSLLFVVFFGVIVYLGTKPVDLMNRMLMGGLIFAYMGIIFFGLTKIKGSLLLYLNKHYLFFALPVLITSFGFHNMIPSLTAYMKGDLKRMRTTVIMGSLLVLVFYLLWNFLVLGIIPSEGKVSLMTTYQEDRIPTHVLAQILNQSWVGVFGEGFAFFAIITSFLAQSLGLTHFLADGFRVSLSAKNRIWLICLALGPPLICALIYPKIFYKALGFAGGFCATILFGILPITMAWIGRYQKKLTSSYHVGGGKAALIMAFIFSLFVVLREVIQLFQ